MVRIFTYIYHRYQPNVGKYNIHAYYGFESFDLEGVSQGEF